MMALLIDHGANINAVNNDNESGQYKKIDPKNNLKKMSILNFFSFLFTYESIFVLNQSALIKAILEGKYFLAQKMFVKLLNKLNGHVI